MILDRFYNKQTMKISLTQNQDALGREYWCLENTSFIPNTRKRVSRTEAEKYINRGDFIIFDIPSNKRLVR